MEVVKDEDINLLEYGYTKDASETSLPSEAIFQLMIFAKAVAESEEHSGFMHTYPKNKPKVHKDKGGDIEAIEVDWDVYPTAKSFFNQNPQLFHTALGASALDLLNKMQAIHLENIKSGKAVKLGVFAQNEKQEQDPKFS